jgi:hypothetical protein
MFLRFGSDEGKGNNPEKNVCLGSSRFKGDFKNNFLLVEL